MNITIQIINIYDFSVVTQLFMLNLMLFLIGAYGFFFFSNHYIYLILCNELMIFSIMLQFLLIAHVFQDLNIQIFVLFILLLSSAEVVVIFSIIIRYYKVSDITTIYPVYYL